MCLKSLFDLFPTCKVIGKNETTETETHSLQPYIGKTMDYILCEFPNHFHLSPIEKQDKKMYVGLKLSHIIHVFIFEDSVCRIVFALINRSKRKHLKITISPWHT